MTKKPFDDEPQQLDWRYFTRWRTSLDVVLGALGLGFCSLLLMNLLHSIGLETALRHGGIWLLLVVIALLAWFVARSFLRLFLRFAITQQAFYSTGLLQAQHRLLWTNLRRFRLRAYPARLLGNKKQKIYQLRLIFAGYSFEIDSHENDFIPLCAQVDRQHKDAKIGLSADAHSFELLQLVLAQHNNL